MNLQELDTLNRVLTQRKKEVMSADANSGGVIGFFVHLEDDLLLRPGFKGRRKIGNAVVEGRQPEVETAL